LKTASSVADQSLSELIELENYSTSLSTETSLSSLRDELERKQGALAVALKLPEDHTLALSAYRIARVIKQKCASSLEQFIREETVTYNASNFNETCHQANYLHLASTLGELFELGCLIQKPELLLTEYLEVKLAAVQRKVAFDSSREYTTLLQFSSNFLWRELEILKTAAEGVRKHAMKSFISKGILAVLSTVSTWLHKTDMSRFSHIAKEVKTKSQIWESSYEKFLLVFEEAHLRETLSQEDWNRALSVVLEPVMGLADFICMEIDERFHAEISDKQKITEVEEKLQTLDFGQFAVAIEQTLDLAVKMGFSLRLVNWVNSTERFLASVNKKILECLRIIEKFYFEEQTELREDPFLQINLPLFHKFYARSISLDDIWPHLEKISLPFSKLNITKKVSVSLQEVLLTKFSDYIVFLQRLDSIDSLMDKAASSPNPLLAIISKLQGVAPHHKKFTVPKSLVQEFLLVDLRLLAKDLRIDASKYIENLSQKLPGNNQILMAIDQHYTQVTYRIDQICNGESEEKLLSYGKKRKDEFEGYPGGKDQTGSFVSSSIAIESKLSGISYWRELLVVSLFTYFLMFAKSEEEKIDKKKLEEDLEALKKTFRRTLKYPIN
jgi:hypothetical protein